MTKPDGKMQVVYREPFSFDKPYFDLRNPGESIEEVVYSIPGLPLRRFLRDGFVTINGEIAPRELWRMARPKDVIVGLHLPPRGGKGGVKAIFAVVAAVALTIATAGIASAGIPALGIAAGTLAAKIAAGVVGLIGSLAINALSKPPTVSDGTSAEQKEAASADGNVLIPNGPIPRVIGERKLYPPYAGYPIVEIVDDDMYVSFAGIMAGPHRISSPQINDTDISDVTDVQIEMREGWPDDTPISLITRQGYLERVGVQMTSFVRDNDDQDKLKHQSNPSSDIPLFHRFATRAGPDEVWIHLFLPAGLNKNGDTGDKKQIPFRMRMRRRGTSAWTNFPEFHYGDKTTKGLRRAVKLIKGTAPALVAPPGRGFIFATKNAPGQSVTPTSSAWVADSYFSAGSGMDYLYTGITTTNLINVRMFGDRIEFYLDDTIFPDGIYDIEIKRGVTLDSSQFSQTAYTYEGGQSRDFFWYRFASGIYTPAESAENYADVVQLETVQSIWNEHPLPEPGFAVFAVRALNRSINSFSVRAAGYVRDWDGSDWTNWITTNNPAPHYADALCGSLTAEPLPEDLRSNSMLVAWRQDCIDYDWTCDAIIEDTRTQDFLEKLAGCGYAHTYMSENYGVIVDKDRSGEAPETLYSPVSASDIRWEKAFPRLPDGFLVTYRDKYDEDRDAQVTVYRRNYIPADDALLENVSYDGLIDLDKVVARSQFDLDQAELRQRFVYCNVRMEAIENRRGDLVALQSDFLSNYGSQAWLKSAVVDEGADEIVQLVLNSKLPIFTEPFVYEVPNVYEIENVYALGVATGIAIERADGTISTHQVANPTGDWDVIDLVIPIPDTPSIIGTDDEQERNGEIYGCEIVCGQLGREYRRMILAGMTFNSDATVDLTLVDEAPDLVRYAGYS